MEKTPILEKFIERFQSIVNHYANTAPNLQSIGMGKEDLKQELNIRLYEALIYYGKKWGKYLQGLGDKPINIDCYIKFGLKNRVRDFVNQLSRKTRFTPIDFDLGEERDNSIVEINESSEDSQAIIDGVDLFEGLEGKDKELFLKFLKGISLQDLTKEYGSERVKVVNEQRDKMKKILSHTSTYQSYFVKTLQD